MKTHIQKHGNDFIVVIPETIANAANLQGDTEVNMSVIHGRLLIEIAKPRYTLEELLAGVTDDNLHGETDTGSSVGREIG